MPDFRMATHGDKVQINFGNEAHLYPRPNDAIIERIIAAFQGEPAPLVGDEIVLDQAIYDG